VSACSNLASCPRFLVSASSDNPDNDRCEKRYCKKYHPNADHKANQSRAPVQPLLPSARRLVRGQMDRLGTERPTKQLTPANISQRHPGQASGRLSNPAMPSGVDAYATFPCRGRYAFNNRSRAHRGGLISKSGSIFNGAEFCAAQSNLASATCQPKQRRQKDLQGQQCRRPCRASPTGTAPGLAAPTRHRWWKVGATGTRRLAELAIAIDYGFAALALCDPIPDSTATDKENSVSLSVLREDAVVD
jgi:hypothetical protein